MTRRRRPVDAAIVGMACRFPGAGDLFAYWANILAGKVPSDRGDSSTFRDPDSTAATGGEPEQDLVLDAARAALADAGLPDGPRDGQRVEVVVARRDDFQRVGAAGASSLLAVDRAARALAEGRADLALAVGVQLEAEADDGTLASVGAVVLKRLVDAGRDGDRVYAVIKAVGLARDGRGRGPARAIRRAYRRAQIDPASVDLIEGHGSGGPATELARPAAEIAGLIKTALALHQRALPPTLHADRPHPLRERVDSPVSLNRSTRPWIHGDPSTPRRAAVNAFGFAGINAHAVLEEHPASADAICPGALLDWDSEAILLGDSDRPGLLDRARSLRDWLRRGPEVSLKDLASTLNAGAKARPKARLGLVAGSLADLADRLDATIPRLEDPTRRSIRDARGAYLHDGEPGRLAFLFPGEGSQYPGMLADLCIHFPEVRARFDIADRVAREAGAPNWPSEHLFGPGGDLWSAGVGVNVVLSAQWALYGLLGRLGLRPDAVVGHSSGEMLALAGAGVLDVDRDLERRLGELGAVFDRLVGAGDVPAARLVALGTDRGRAEAACREAGVEDEVVVAMDNCPHQVVLAGPPGAVEAAVAALRGRGVACEDLPFARAYHTEAFAPAIGPIAAFFDALELGRPRVPIYSCASGARMPDDPAAIRALAVAQWTRVVDFRGTIEAMHADGCRVFVDVGARGNLAGFVEDTLRGRDAFAVAANLPRRSGTLQLNHLVASLYARGVPIDPAHLYARRRPQRVDLDATPRPASPKPTLAVGFPTMRLSDDLAARLGRRPAPTPEVAATSVFNRIEGPFAPINRVADWLESEPVGVAVADPVAMPDDAVDDTMLAYLKTMESFLETQAAVMAAHLGSDADPIEHPGAIPGPWAGEVASIVEGIEVEARVTIDIPGDPVAEHHTLGGRRVSALDPTLRGLAVLPFSVMAEMLAEAAARLVGPGVQLVALRNVRAHRWVRFEDGPIALEVHARRDPSRPDEVRVAIRNPGRAAINAGVELPVFEGTVVFGQRPGPDRAAPFALDDARPCRFTAESMYEEQWLFHGPALQAVSRVGAIGHWGIEGSLRVLPQRNLLREGATGDLLTDPIVLDAFTHLLGSWGLDQLADDGDVIFPLGMGELAIFGDDPPEGAEVECRVAVRELERHRVRADAEIVRPDGRVWMRISGWDDWRFRWPARYRDVMRQPDRTFLGEALPLPNELAGIASAVWLEPPGDMGRPVWRDVLEQTQLGPIERAAYLAHPGPDLRRTHRLWGRIAAKEAARRIWVEQGGPPVYPADLAIEPDTQGKPWLRSLAEPGRPDLPAVSIGHADGVAVALAAVDPDARIGVDVEPIVERSAGFEALAFTPDERSQLDRFAAADRAEWASRFWCAKEALAKSTGLGLVDGPAGVQVVGFDPEGGTIDAMLQGSLATACPDLAGDPIQIGTGRRGGYIWAWTLGAKGGTS